MSLPIRPVLGMGEAQSETHRADSSDTTIMRLAKPMEIQAPHGRNVSLMEFVTGKPLTDILNWNQATLRFHLLG